MSADTLASGKMKDVQRARRRRGMPEEQAAMRLPSIVFTIYMFLFLLLAMRNVPTAVSFSYSSWSLPSFPLQQRSNAHAQEGHRRRSSITQWSSSLTTTRRGPVPRKEGKMIHSIRIITTFAARGESEQNPLSVTTAVVPSATKKNIWEQMAMQLVNVQKEEGDDHDHDDPSSLFKDYVNMISALRIGLPAFMIATISNIVYPTVAMTVASMITDYDSDSGGVFAVVSQDASQYIQNILTTSGLVFSLLVGQTFYFMYQQQEAIYLALFEEVTMAKSLLEQVALVCQGRENLYQRILLCIDRYVSEDLQRFNDYEPAMLLSARPVDDPLEDILYLTSVGEPSVVYQTVRALRQARAYRLGALQRKLPPIHMTLLWVLFAIVLFTFPLLGAGSQTIGGMALLHIQAWYLSFIVFGMCLTLFMIDELQRPGEDGAYSARAVLGVMLRGLEEELDLRLQGKMGMPQFSDGPSIDADGYND